MTGDDLKLGHPKQRVDYDLSKDPKEQRRDSLPAPSFETIKCDRKDPEALMRQLGFEPTDDLSPLQFLIAVMNDRIDVVYKNENRRKRMEGKGGISLQYRMDAAKTASKYLHMEMPKMQIQSSADAGFGEELANAIRTSNTRVVDRGIILQKIEQISPDIPLAPANYPPEFMDAVINEPDDLNDGNIEYDPDAEDDEYTE